jgi:hypothetical protein
LIDTRHNLQSIQPTFPETGILFYSTGAVSSRCAAGPAQLCRAQDSTACTARVVYSVVNEKRPTKLNTHNSD